MAANFVDAELTKWCKPLATPVSFDSPNWFQPPIFSGVPYLKRTFWPPVHWDSAPVAVTCLLNPGKKPNFCNRKIPGYKVYIRSVWNSNA